ncbi:hypothetical protein ACHAWU_006505 [Discostella pseudostelligera]|uniref:Uncharacterized protein n=1 Tax=Discostella pseudostelligera TaxID=259834 RepID=A0ABD3MLT5_9STRA
MMTRFPNDDGGSGSFVSPFQPYYHQQQDYSSYSSISASATRRPRIGAHGRQQQRRQRVNSRTTATTFASAVSPPSSSTIPSNSTPTKQRRTRRMTSPLLGVASSPPHHPAKRSRLDSLRALAPMLPSINLSLSLPAPPVKSSKACHKPKSNGSKKNALKNVRAILAKVNNRGKKTTTTACTSHSPRTSTTTATTVALSYQCSQPESRNSLEQEVHYMGTMETTTDDEFMSLEPDVFNTCIRLTPLTFDDTQVPNHFRSDAGGNIHVINQREDAIMEIEEPLSSSRQCSEEKKLQNDEGTPRPRNRWRQQQSVEGEDEFLSLDLEDDEDMFTQLEEGEDMISIHVDDSDNEEESSAHKVVVSQEISREEDNRMKFNDMLNKVVICRGVGLKSTPEMFYTSYNSTVSELSYSKPGGEGQDGLLKRRNSSNDSIPSLSGDHNNAEVVGAISPEAPMNATNVDEVAESTIAWGCLAALMSSPAPSPVRECKKRTSTPVKNLWQDDDLSPHAEVLDDIVSLPHDDDGEDLDDELRSLNIVADNCSIPSCKDLDDHDQLVILDFPSSPPKSKLRKVEDSKLAWSVLGAILGSPAPSSVSKKYVKKCVNLWDDDEETDVLEVGVDDIISLPPDDDEEEVPAIDDATDNCSIPSCNDLDPNVDDCFPTTPPKANSRKAEDSALAWSVLGAILGSPAPSSVAKKSVKKCINLWDDDGETDVLEVGDDIISLPPYDDDEEVLTFEDEADSCSIPSCNDLVSNVDNCTSLDFPTTPTKANSRKAEDSALAWSILGAILGSPAPTSVTKKSVKQCINLWDEDEGESDPIPEIDGQCCDVDNDDGVSDPIPEIDGQCGYVDDDLSATIDLNELLVGSDESTVPTISIESTQADSVLAWSALGMLLGSPAPKSIPKKSGNKCSNLWKEADGECDHMPEIDGQSGDHVGDDLSATIDLNELPAEPADDIFPAVAIESAQTDSVLAWSALGMLLGSPAPKSVSKQRSSRAVSKNLWDDGTAIEDASNAVPFISTGDENDSIILSPWKVPLGQRSWLGCHDVSDGEDSHSTHSRVPSLSATSDGEEDAPQTPVSQLIMLFENL